MPGILIFACFIVTVWGLWLAASIHLQASIKIWYFRNVVAGTVALFFGLIVVGLMYAGWFGGLLGLAITAGAAFAPQRQKEKLTAVPEVLAVPVPPVAPEKKPEPASEPVANNTQDEVRRRSLEAMNRSTEARQRDMAVRNEKPAAPLAGWSPSGAVSSIACIEFDYVDARGKKSHRVVDVTAVDREYLEGYCHTALDTRTFIIGRIRGQLLVRDTGELTTPKKWAAEARRDPRNGDITMGGENHQDDEDDIDLDFVPAEAIGAEIVFTGFPKGERAELEALAEAANMQVRKSVPVCLDFLCTGPTAGPAKIRQAQEAGATIFDRDGFMEMLRGD